MSNLRLDARLYITWRQRKDGLALTSNQLGFTVYGNDKEEANEAMVSALTTLVDSFRSLPAAREFLDGRGIKHTVSLMAESDVAMLPQAGSLEVKVLVGATE